MDILDRWVPPVGKNFWDFYRKEVMLMELIYWIILVMIDMYKTYRLAINLMIKYLIDSIKNALPVSHTGRAPRKR